MHGLIHDVSTHTHAHTYLQLDSAICSSQRHLLRGFVEAQPRGWYGAPWPHVQRGGVGGNGGFSLRRRAFVSTILER